MSISSTVSTTKERKASSLPVRTDTSPRILSEARERNENASGTTGTFVYLKARRGVKSSSAEKATEEWRPKMWTYIRWLRQQRSAGDIRPSNKGEYRAFAYMTAFNFHPLVFFLSSRALFFIIPAEAGVQWRYLKHVLYHYVHSLHRTPFWIPAFAGMTGCVIWIPVFDGTTVFNCHPVP